MVGLSVSVAIGLSYPVNLASYVVDSVEAKRTFAGRLGFRITERLVVAADGQRFEVSIRGAFHTRVGSEYAGFERGDRLRMRTLVEGRENIVDRYSIRRLR